MIGSQGARGLGGCTARAEQAEARCPRSRHAGEPAAGQPAQLHEDLGDPGLKLDRRSLQVVAAGGNQLDKVGSIRR
jgi:hypothetical protein